MFMVQMLILVGLVFVGMVVFLRRLVGRHATTATSHLQGLAQEYLARQEELKKRLGEVDQRYHEQLAKAREEAQSLKDQTLQEAELAKRQILEKAQQDAEKIVRQAMEVQEAMKKELEKLSSQKATEQACVLIQEALPNALRQEIHSAWVKKFVNGGLSQLSGRKLPSGVREAQVRSAFPLSQDERQHLTKQLKSSFDQNLPLKETTDDSLVAGLTVTLGSLVLDGSLISKVREAVRHVQQRDSQ